MAFALTKLFLKCQCVIYRSNQMFGHSRILLSRYSTDRYKTSLVTRNNFADIENKSKDTYLDLVNIYKTNEIQRRGHVEFIYTALKYMKEFGVEKDLEAYKSLIDVLPKGKMIPKNIIQAEFMHYPKQQQCAIDLLEQMEENGVIPDWDTEDILLNIFGKRGHPLRRYYRMMYWMPKLKNASPWPLPDVVPRDSYELAMLAIERIVSVDPNSKVTVFETSEIEGALEATWIVSGQAPDQTKLINNLPDNTPIFVDGRYRIWLKNKAVTYFVLRTDYVTKREENQDYDDLSKIKNPIFAKPEFLPERAPSVHEQEEGTLLAVCSTGTSSRDSLLCWIKCLEIMNPRLTKLPIIFTLKSPKEESNLMTQDTKDS